MAELVEIGLEKLLPTFEQLRAVELLSPEEVSTLIKRCRSYEYQAAKWSKEPKDFIQYAEYVDEVVQLLKDRRQEIGYHHKGELIEKPLKYKAAFLYRLCSDRFKKIEYFHREIAYLKSANLLGVCSQAYTRLLQLHGHDPRNHEEAGLFEFFQNKSAENARTILQSALRKFPSDQGLWIALFNVELNYVNYLQERRKHLLAEGEPKEKRNRADVSAETEEVEAPVVEEGEQSDAILQMKLAEIVFEQALKAVPEQDLADTMYRMWQTAAKCGPFAKKMKRELYEKMQAHEPELEEAVLARLQSKNKLHNVALFEAALELKPTLKMLRLYISYCDTRIELGDTFAHQKLPDLFQRIHSLGQATQEDYRRLFDLLQQPEEDEALAKWEPVFLDALRVLPHSSTIWEKFLQAKLDALLRRDNRTVEEGDPQVEELSKLIEEALTKLPANESLAVWETYIDLTVATNTPKRIDKFFDRAFLKATPAVAAELKVIRLRYVIEQSGEDIDRIRKEYQQLAKMLPTSFELHKSFIELERERGRASPTATAADIRLITSAFENAVVEFGQGSVDCWIEYLKFLLEAAPERVGAVNQRAAVNLPPEQLEDFYEQWTKVSMGSSTGRG